MSAAFHFKIEQTKAFLFQGQLGMAQGILNELETQSSVQSRWKDHYLGIIKMRQGSFDEAINLFLNTLSKNGNYLSIILDLASCYFMTGQMCNWQRMVDLANDEYKNNSQKLGLSRRIQSCVLLTKYLEEKGLIHESLENYQELLDLLPADDLKIRTNPEYVRITAQILRVHGQYGLKNCVVALYQELCTHDHSNTHMDCDFEIQHALMIYELQFLGVETAMVRYQRVLANPLADSFELQWVQADLFYGLLARGYTQPAAEMQSQISAELNVFNQAISRVIQEKNLSLQYYMDCVARITPAAQLRLLKLWSMHSKNPLPLKRQKLLIHLFSKKTKVAWENYFKASNNQSPSVVVTVKVESNLSRLEISPGDQAIFVSKSHLEVFELFIRADRLTLSEACQILWNSEGTESEISRLRMRISRLNDFLQTQLGIKGGFKLDKTHLKTNLQISKK